jgi:hypothetical protein
MTRSIARATAGPLPAWTLSAGPLRPPRTTAPGIADLGAEYSLLLDGGCLHGLPDRSLRRAVATITDAAKPGATLLMLAFAPGRRGPVPRGIDPAWIPSLFPQWDLTFSRPASEVMINKRLRSASPSWHQLTRQ